MEPILPPRMCLLESADEEPTTRPRPAALYHQEVEAERQVLSMEFPHLWKPYFGLLRRNNGFRKQCILCGVVSTSDQMSNPPEADMDCPFAKLEPEIER